MAETRHHAIQTVIVEEHFVFTLADLCRACDADDSQVRALVDEGLLAPTGDGPGEWRFAGQALQRARTALRLARDLDLQPADAALVMGLLDEIDSLRRRLRRLGAA
jgi:chaperone modulatory protein CbpM